jgi:hypothetical protein
VKSKFWGNPIREVTISGATDVNYKKTCIIVLDNSLLKYPIVLQLLTRLLGILLSSFPRVFRVLRRRHLDYLKLRVYLPTRATTGTVYVYVQNIVRLCEQDNSRVDPPALKCLTRRATRQIAISSLHVMISILRTYQFPCQRYPSTTTSSQCYSPFTNNLSSAVKFSFHLRVSEQFKGASTAGTLSPRQNGRSSLEPTISKSPFATTANFSSHFHCNVLNPLPFPLTH